MPQPSRPTRRALALLPAIALLGMLGACGGSGDSGDAEEARKKGSPTATPGAPSGKAPAALSEAKLLSTLIAAQGKAGSARFTTTLRNGNDETVLSGEVLFGKEKALRVGDEGIDFIVLDDVLYMRGPGFKADGYYRIDLAKAGEDDLWARAATGYDPQMLLTLLERPTSFTVVGEEATDGVATLHYRLTLSPRAYARVQPDIRRVEVADPVQFDIWVDGANRPVRLTQDLRLEFGGEQLVQYAEVAFTDYGTKVAVEAPAKDEIEPGKPSFD